MFDVIHVSNYAGHFRLVLLKRKLLVEYIVLDRVILINKNSYRVGTGLPQEPVGPQVTVAPQDAVQINAAHQAQVLGGSHLLQ